MYIESPCSIFDVVKSTSEQKVLDMNVKKTKTMVISKKMKSCKQKSKLTENNLKNYNNLNIQAKQLPKKAKVTRKLRFASHKPNQ